MSAIEELREYVNELHIRIDYDDYVNLIDYVDEVEAQIRPKEDLMDWIVDNFIAIEEDVLQSIAEYCKQKDLDDETINLKNFHDRQDLKDEICENLKEGLLNVVETYKEE